MIKLIKFISGEEIICETPNSHNLCTDATWEISNAVTLMYSQSDEGKTTVGFTPFMPTSDGTITVLVQSMVSISDVQEGILKQYRRIFSPIIVP